MVASPSSATRHNRQWADDVAPENLDAEMVVLNCLIVGDAKSYAAVRPLLNAGMFTNPDHGAIFDLIAEARDAGGAMDGFILRTELERRGELNGVGGEEAIISLLHAAPNPNNVASYVAPVIETYRLRIIDKIMIEARKAIRLPAYGRDPSSAIIEQVQNRLAGLVESSASNDIQTLSEVMDETMKEMLGGGAPRIPTGIDGLDAKIGGLGMGEMTLVAARPSMGKSLLGKQIADNIAQRSVPIFYGNCEEMNKKTGRNWLARNAKIANWRVRKGSLTKAEWETAAHWTRYSKDLPFYLCDRAMGLAEMCNVITLAHSRHKVKAVFVDYLQLIEANGGDTREQEVSKISRQLKNLFKRLNVAGLVIAQLNRASEHGGIRPPRLSDLRDSGQIEQDADVVLLIHRPDFYCREQGGTPTGKAQIIIAKNRDGSREDDVELRADLEHQEFVEEVQADPFA